MENPLKRQFFHKNILTVSLCHFSVIVDAKFYLYEIFLFESLGN